jgi:hypothetical protein
MAFHDLIKSLRKTEQELLKQLSGVREAISSLELGGAVSPSMPAGKGTQRISKAGRARIAAAQKARWARQKAGKKK